MIDPPKWTDEQLDRDRAAGIEAFRSARMQEPLQKYLVTFDQKRGEIEDLLDKLVNMTGIENISDEAVLAILGNQAFLDAFRYLAGPPVSADDLRVVSGAASLSPKALRENRTMARAVYQTVLQGLDSRRFPWVIENREPTEAERKAAVIASAALMATQRLATDRRNEGKTAQEHAVFRALQDVGFVQVGTRSIATLDDAPEPGQFCPESLLGRRKADIVARLHDRRVLAIECKVSNSSTNSIKRLNNDAAVKAVEWIKEFGTRQLIPSAVLSGVFKLRNLVDAQNNGLTLWWAHDLQTFQGWINETAADAR